MDMVTQTLFYSILSITYINRIYYYYYYMYLHYIIHRWQHSFDGRDIDSLFGKSKRAGHTIEPVQTMPGLLVIIQPMQAAHILSARCTLQCVLLPHGIPARGAAAFE